MNKPGSGLGLSDRIQGCLLGAACGDALGLPFEGQSRVDPSQLRAWSRASDLLVHSDDTALLRTLAHHLVGHGGQLKDEGLVLDFARAWRAEPDRGYGIGPPLIFRAALAGGDWSGVAQGLFGGLGSLGNGGAMRVAPVALLPAPVSVRVELARRRTAVTHCHPEALDGAALLCAAISHVFDLAGEPLTTTDLADRLAPYVTTAEFRERLQLMSSILRHRLTPRQVADRLGNDVSARGSVPTAITLFLMHPDDPGTAFTSAIAAGGDTDTIAAMVGALNGARLGAGRLPPAWVDRLEAGPGLRQLAERMVALRPVA